jgi:hypothetical protein
MTDRELLRLRATLQGPVQNRGWSDPRRYTASQLQRAGAAAVKTATLPSLRVEPELRAAAESVLAEGESLSGFIEASVRESIERRRVRAEFIARGLAARDEARLSGDYVDADQVLDKLQRKLGAARARVVPAK